MKLSDRYPSINDVKKIATRGPWRTKSNGQLMVLFALSEIDLQSYFSYDQKELAQIPQDIRGLRSYTVRDLPQSEVGGGEFHRIRKEMVFGLEGSVKWQCEDLFGNKTETIITPNVGIYLPPYILHTYEVIEDKSGLLVIANTLFDPDDSRTHDTYSQKEFIELQK